MYFLKEQKVLKNLVMTKIKIYSGGKVMSKVINYAGEDFEKETVAEGITLVDFAAVWCGPCQMLEPALEELSKTASYKIVKVDVDQSSELAAKYKVRSVPMMIVFKDGEEMERLLGFMTQDEISKKMKAYI